MKKVFKLVAVLCLAAIAVVGATACGSAKYPVTDGKFTVVTNCPFGVYEYIGDDDKAYGIDIELAGMFAKQEGLELVVKNIEFDSIFNEVKAGNADAGMAGITVTEDRKKSFAFTSTYAKASQKLVVLNSNTDFDGKTTAAEVEAVLSGLSDKKIGYQTGTTGGMYINGDEDFGYDGFANITGKGYDTAVLAAQDMKNGNVYAVVVDEGPAAAIVQAVDGVKVIDVKLTDEDYAFLLKKNNSKLQEKFNAFIKTVKENGEYDKLVDKYFNGNGEKVGYAISK